MPLADVVMGVLWMKTGVLVGVSTIGVDVLSTSAGSVEVTAA